MRQALERLAGARLAYTATFVRYGRSILVERGQARPRRGCALLRDVLAPDGGEAAEHVWVNETAGIVALGVKAGDRLRFTAVARAYWKGVRSAARPTAEDYKLTDVQDVILVTDAGTKNSQGE